MVNEALEKARKEHPQFVLTKKDFSSSANKKKAIKRIDKAVSELRAKEKVIKIAEATKTKSGLTIGQDVKQAVLTQAERDAIIRDKIISTQISSGEVTSPQQVRERLGTTGVNDLTIAEKKLSNISKQTGFSKEEVEKGKVVTKNGDTYLEIKDIKPKEKQKEYPILTEVVIPSKPTFSNFLSQTPTYVSSLITSKANELRTRQAREGESIRTNLPLFTLGLGKSISNTGEFVVNSITHPIKTFKQIVEGTGALIKNPRGVGGNIEESLRIDTSSFVGELVGDVLIFEGVSRIPKFITKALDIGRTSKLRELEVVKPGDIPFIRRGKDVFFDRTPTGQFKRQKFEIIATEFFEGQQYPLIKKGQTAGSLKSEFQPLLPGEKLPAGYSATPKPFGRTTIVTEGASELPGVYQAGRLSPNFLRIAGESERRFISWNVFDVLRPTAVRITSPINLVPGVSSSRTSLFSLTKARKFFSKKAKVGETYIPFIKREKEGILTVGTNLERTDKRFWFNFRERRVIIEEMKVVETGERVNIIKRDNIVKSGEKGSYSSFPSGEVGIINPSQIPLVSYSITKSSKFSSPIVSPITSINYNSSSSSVSSKSKSIKISSERVLPSSNFTSGSSKTSNVIPSVSYSYVPSSISSSYGGSSYGGSSYGSGGGSSYGYNYIDMFRGGGGFRPKSSPKKSNLEKRDKDLFSVSVRRYGKFRPIGTNLNLNQAINVGRQKVSTGLGATFKITPTKKGKVKGNIRTPKGFKQKKGLLFIEDKRLRLSKVGEVKEIQLARRVKI